MPAYSKSWASWSLAVIFLFVFCWLGVAAFRFAQVYEGFQDRLPLTTRLFVAYGSVACPILGVFAAAGLVLLDLFCRRQWVQVGLIVAIAVAIVLIFRTLVFSAVFMGPAIRTARLTRLTIATLEPGTCSGRADCRSVAWRAVVVVKPLHHA